MSYENNIVKKPWGFEYLVYQNDNVGLWLLHIEKDQCTSTHCHPKKNTGLVLLEGEAEVSFLNDKFRLTAPSKVMIRRGLFHSTKALSDGGINLFEIETPRKKDDLVRLKDNYGRELRPYEGKEYESEKQNDCLWLEDDDYKKGIFDFCGRKLQLQKCSTTDDLKLLDEEALFMCLKGGLKTENNDVVYQPGDVITSKVYEILKEQFKMIDSSIILTISK